MHTVQLLSEAITVAQGTGYQIREEALEGAGGGHCLIRGQKWLLLDLTQSHQEQLNDVLDALRCELDLPWDSLPQALVVHLKLPKAA